MRLHLASIEKSGTNYFRICLFNYLCHLAGDEQLKTYDDLTEAFPNSVRKGEVGRSEARADLLPEPYTDFVYGHSPRSPWDLGTPGGVIFLARNPLDNVVSWWHHAHQRKGNRIPLEDMFANRLRQFGAKYRNMKSLSQEHGAKIVYYEDIIEDPANAFREAFESVHLPIEPRLIELAASHASIKNAQAFEEKFGFMHVSDKAKRRPGGKTRFVRDGSIGQWAQHFEWNDCLQMMDEAKIPIEEFRYRPSVS